MAQSLARVVLHVVFSTKNRTPFLREADLLSCLHAYVAGQEEHHRKVLFQDKYRALCAKHGVTIDERYVWDCQFGVFLCQNVRMKKEVDLVQTCQEEATGLSDADSRSLFMLMGEVVFSNEPLETKRLRVLKGLCDFVGADGCTTEVRPGIFRTRSISRQPAFPGEPIESDVTFSRSDSGEQLAWCWMSASGETNTLLLFRDTGKTPFSEREETLARVLVEEISWLPISSGQLPAANEGAACPSRKQQVLRLLCLGWDRKGIAVNLGISASTVATYQKSLYREHGVGTQVELMQILHGFSSHEHSPLS
jgi:DNA-binding CsgD family transcriptional regulator